MVNATRHAADIDLTICIHSSVELMVVPPLAITIFKTEHTTMNNHENATVHRGHCAECGKEGGVSLKVCKLCMQVKYCDATCQKNHWPTHKAACKQRAAELRDEALFKHPPAKEDCPICFLPMPVRLICCVSLPPATILSVPIYDLAIANDGLEDKETEIHYPCCGKSICAGCKHSFNQTGNADKCPFCNTDRSSITVEGAEETVEKLMKRVEANDAASMRMLAQNYKNGELGLQQDHAKATELYARSAELGFSKAHCHLGDEHLKGGNLKKAKFHWEAAAMAGHENARYNLGCMGAQSGNMEQAVKHWTIAASAGCFRAMHNLLIALEDREVSRDSIDSTLEAYNNSCADMKSKDRDACIQAMMMIDLITQLNT
jgi:TPR repeat protein